MDPSAIGAILGGAFVVIWGAFKILDRFAPARQGKLANSSVCPLGADPELKALLARQVDAQTQLMNAVAKMEMQYELHAERIDEVRRDIGEVRRDIDRIGQ